jgi:hypothetical protein
MGYSRFDQRRCWNVDLDVATDDHEIGWARMWRLPGQEFVQHDAGGVDV